MTKFQKSVWQLIREFRFNSVFFSYLKHTLFLLIVPFVIITIFMTYITYLSVKTETEKKSEQIVLRSEYIFTDAFNSINELYQQFTSDKKILYLITADTAKTDAYTLTQSTLQYYNSVSSATTGSNFLHSVFLYSKRNSYIYATDSSNLISEFSNLEWYEAYLKNNQKNTVCSSVINDTPVVSVIMNIYPESKHSGVLVFNIAKSYLDSAATNDSKGDIIYSAHLTNGANKVYTYNEQIPSSAPVVFDYSYDISGYSVSYHGFFSCNLPRLTLKRMLPIAFPYFIFTIISIIFVAFMCSLKFYKSIVNIMTIFETVTFKSDMYSENYNELHYINDNIVNMLLHSKEVENDLVLRFSELKKAQSIALQTQMNPHFLFNTLNLVNTIIIEDCGRDTDAVAVINTLAQLLSLSLDTKSYIVAVESELDYAKKYIDIELIRNDYNFIIDWEISPEILQCKTLKMILQPILENAVFHGISNMQKDEIGKITVRAYAENENLIFSISDNGRGIPENILKQLGSKLNSNEIVETKHIGIANVNSRIRIIYGDEYGCRIVTSSEGTTIIITQPVK